MGLHAASKEAACSPMAASRAAIDQSSGLSAAGSATGGGVMPLRVAKALLNDTPVRGSNITS